MRPGTCSANVRAPHSAVAAEESPNSQPDHRSSSGDRRVGELALVATVHPIRRTTTMRAFAGDSPRTRPDLHCGADLLDTLDRHLGEVSQQNTDSIMITARPTMITEPPPWSCPRSGRSRKVGQNQFNLPKSGSRTAQKTFRDNAGQVAATANSVPVSRISAGRDARSQPVTARGRISSDREHGHIRAPYTGRSVRVMTQPFRGS